MTSITSSKSVSPVNWSRKEYGFFQLSGNQTTGISANDPVKFNTPIVNNMTFDPATYRVTLKANKTYSISSALYILCSANTGYAQYRIYDVTNASLVGMTGTAIVMTYTSLQVGTQEVLEHYITTVVDTIIEIRLTAVNSLDTIYSIGSYFKIQEIDTFSPNTQKWDYAYVSPEINITTTCTDTGGTITKAVAKFLKTSDGNWSMEFNITGTKTAKASTTVTFTGISVRTTGFTYIPVTFYDAGGVAYTIYALFTSATSFTASQSTTTTGFYMYGKVPLSAKPTGYAVPSDV